MIKAQAIRRLLLIIAIYLFFGLFNSFALPLHESSDEIAHFQYFRFIARNGHLPTNYDERADAGYRSDWPALYHILVAAVAGWADSDEPPFLKFVWESPRFEMAQQLLDTKRLANTEDELFPYRGTVLMWHLGRLVSLALGVATIVIVYITALEIFPAMYRMAITAAALAAFMPTFVFISSALSDDPLLGLLGGLYILILVRMFKGYSGWWYVIALGILLGLSATTKYSAVVLPLEIMVLLGGLAWQYRWGVVGWLTRLVAVGGISIIASSWWYIFLIVYFNEIEQYGPIVGSIKPIIAGGVDRSQRFAAYLLTGGQIGISDSPEFIAEPFWKWALQMFQSFWVIKIGTYPLEPLMFIFAGSLLILTTVGLVMAWRRRPNRRVWIALFLFHLAVYFVFPLIRYLILRDLSQSAQGRHILFPIITLLPIMLLMGWQEVSRPLRKWLPLIVVSALLLWNLAQSLRLLTYYDTVHTWLPVTTLPLPESQLTERAGVDFGDRLRLVGYETTLVPEQNALKLSLYWQADRYPDEDYRRVIDLENSGQLYLSWETYPTNARYPTRLWESYETIRDDVLIPLVDLPAGDTQLFVQLMGAAGALTVEGGERFHLGDIAVPAAVAIKTDFDFPVTMDDRQSRFGAALWQADAYTRLGLPEYSPRMAISLIWQGPDVPGGRISWLLVGEDGQVYQAETRSDHIAGWQVGADWPTGDYRLRGEIWRDNSVIDSYETGPVLSVVNERPRRMDQPAVSVPLEANFANKVKLLGYDLPLRRFDRGDGIPLTLYWQGLRTMDRSYTVFTKLLDKDLQLWGNAERLPADGYNTVFWLEDEVVVDGFELPVAPDGPDGVYWLNLGLYEEVGGQAVSLPLVLGGQVGDATSVTIGPIKVGESVPDAVIPPGLPESKADVVLGDVIRLSGYGVTQDEHQLKLELYWESMAPTAVDYTVFVHLRDRNGEILAQADQLLTANEYPSSLWQPGDVIYDPVLLLLPQESPQEGYELWVGLYDYHTGERLAIESGTDNSIRLTEIVND
jgi:4-amino-4-deoxy-L-arabinose transferase-like glycosyltransferase